jgi:NAD(P)-dependent dehydrogenase (short-subunit alcohol dehydrogenase family)
MDNAFSLAGRKVLITGGATGIGAATAKVCAHIGAEIVIVDKDDACEVAAEIAKDGGKARAIIADVGARDAMSKVADEVGGVDALVLNAAICPWGEDWLDPEWDESFERVMQVNLLGPMNAVRAFLPAMKGREGARIVLVGSLAGRMGGLIAGPHYVASKGGVHALTKWLARHLAKHKIVVNAVAPASVETPMMDRQPVDIERLPIGRMARPEEIAWPIAFLCSPAASYICGAVLDVNGGVYMS